MSTLQIFTHTNYISLFGSIRVSESNEKDSNNIKNFCFLIKVNEQLVDEGEVCKALEAILILLTVDQHEKERHS